MFAATAAVIGQHFWSDAEGCARDSWNAAFTETEPYRGANSNMHSVEAYLAAGDASGDRVWHQRALSIATHLIDGHARASAWRVPEHYDANWHPLPDYNDDRRADQFRPYGTTPGHSFEWARLLLDLEAALTAPHPAPAPAPPRRPAPAPAPAPGPRHPPGCPRRPPRCSTRPSPTPRAGTATRACSTPSARPASR